jgi:hypothetical protein
VLTGRCRSVGVDVLNLTGTHDTIHGTASERRASAQSHALHDAAHDSCKSIQKALSAVLTQTGKEPLAPHIAEPRNCCTWARISSQRQAPDIMPPPPPAWGMAGAIAGGAMAGGGG